jgi:hypothetical protein
MLLRHYKDDPVPAVRDRHRRVLRRLLYLAIANHERCIARRVGRPVTRRLVVPSLRGRPGPHTLAVISAAMGALQEPTVELVPAGSFVGERVVASGRFTVAPTGAVTGGHVLLIDDTWTTGSRAQSRRCARRAPRRSPCWWSAAGWPRSSAATPRSCASAAAATTTRIGARSPVGDARDGQATHRAEATVFARRVRSAGVGARAVRTPLRPMATARLALPGAAAADREGEPAPL